MIIESMAAQGKEPTFCMGDDIPLAILSQKPHMLYDYFKQRFAQVLWKFSFPDYINTCGCPLICCGFVPLYNIFCCSAYLSCPNIIIRQPADDCMANHKITEP